MKEKAISIISLYHEFNINDFARCATCYAKWSTCPASVHKRMYTQKVYLRKTREMHKMIPCVIPNLDLLHILIFRNVYHKISIDATWKCCNSRLLVFIDIHYGFKESTTMCILGTNETKNWSWLGSVRKIYADFQE